MRSDVKASPGIAIEEERRKINLGVTALRSSIENDKIRSRQAIKTSNRRSHSAFKVRAFHIYIVLKI